MRFFEEKVCVTFLKKQPWKRGQCLFVLFHGAALAVARFSSAQVGTVAHFFVLFGHPVILQCIVGGVTAGGVKE